MNSKILNFRELVSENPSKQVWKYLHFFHDIKTVSNYIHKLHGISSKKHNENIEKQAIQISYCIRQAEEYFVASNNVSLPTRPLLLYYGAVSLSQALILLKNNGKHSIDVLRNTKKHKHHGLNLKTNSFSSKVTTLDFFNAIKCDIHKNDDIPWGHFPLFYQSLIPTAFQVQTQIDIPANGASLTQKTLFNTSDAIKLENLINNDFVTLELFEILPDMYNILIDLGIMPNLSRGQMKLNVIEYFKNNLVSQENFDKFSYYFNFFLNCNTVEQKEKLVSFYKKINPAINIVSDTVRNMHLSLNIESNNPDKQAPLYYLPDIVDDLGGNHFYILEPEKYIYEPVTYFMLLYCFGMLVRYYPDIWMKVIDENIQVAEIIDTFLNNAYRKFPNLILDQMMLTKYYIHI